MPMTTAPFVNRIQSNNISAGIGLQIGGDWTLVHFARLKRQISALHGTLPSEANINFEALGALDTSGAAFLVDLLGAQRISALESSIPGLTTERRLLLQTVSNAMTESASSATAPERSRVLDFLAHIGEVMAEFWQQAVVLLGFIGLTLSTLFSVLPHPQRWRVTSLVAHLEQCGLNAVPIVSLLTFLVGAVVAFLGATILSKFGASIYTVNLVVFSFLREFGVLLTAILLAGRTASAFTAQIGAMKANEEIDAIRTLGLSPIELLVLPRVAALLIALPILTFIAMLSGILGGALVCALSLDISPTMFMSILQQNIELRHFLVGILKAPIFAFLIAVIGCLEGFKVTGSALSVGERTTSSVVQSIFVVILLDALASLFLMEMGW
ncbi:MAG: ABC transporter permease [Georgfuchsia sp.]